MCLTAKWLWLWGTEASIMLGINIFHIPCLNEFFLVYKNFLTKITKMVPRGYFQQVLFLELLFCTPQSRGDGMGSGVGPGKTLEWSVHGRVPSHMLEFDLAVFIRTWQLISWIIIKCKLEENGAAQHLLTRSLPVPYQM